MKRLFLFLIALMLPMSAMALTIEDLTPGKDDATMMAFAYIFGDVGGVFGTGTTSVLGDMFQIFNSAMMIVGGILIGYILLSGTLKTAHEGEVLGRAWSSIWIPVRASVAVGMILPGPSGYALVQVFVMYCAIAGVGMANKTWEVAEQRILFGHSEVSFASDGSKIIDGLLSGYTCQRALNQANSINDVEAEKLSIEPVITNHAKGTTYDWKTCGRVDIPFTSSKNSAVNTIHTAKMTLLNSAAVPHVTLLSKKIVDGTNDKKDSADYGQLKDSFNNQVSDVAKAIFKHIVSGQNSGEAAPVDGSYAFAHKYGWLFAGASYLKLARSYQETSATISSAVNVVEPSYQELGVGSKQVYDTMQAYNAFTNKSSLEYSKTMTAQAQAGGTTTRTPEQISANMESDIRAAVGEEKMPSLLTFIFPIGTIIKTMIFNRDDGTAGLTVAWAASSLTADGLGNPILQLVNFGDIVAKVTISIYIITSTVLSAIVGAGSSLGGQIVGGGVFNPGAAVSTFVSFISPFMSMITLSIVAACMSMSVYLPMMPMIIWTMAVCGYFVLVVESMLASSIWAIMHASPDGHEWSGKGAQGYMIILGMVLRPTLMIFGLVGALILVNVMILVMRTMFSLAAGLVSIESGVGPLAFIVLFFLYVWLAIKIVHRSLDMITEIPSGIMKWVGGGHDPLDPGIGQQGSSFIGGVMNKGEGAAQAGAGAAKGIQSGKDAEKKAQATENAANQRNQDLINAFSGGGKKTDDAPKL